MKPSVATHDMHAGAWPPCRDLQLLCTWRHPREDNVLDIELNPVRLHLGHHGSDLAVAEPAFRIVAIVACFLMAKVRRMVSAKSGRRIAN